ncbi:hypothetical protein GUITHDRAFT_160260 [Guillardia theta CCMP2712]|uniref:Uncharacterized protein n=1 Tax=Guillardia theta (strain CCMP2712) TaxID=905079 RepID=L1ICU3_GUITC|nr:hypothetical protein GUITHDRAFT_160260 [Guillardia theta CCMP2712]EKX34071.1 hypothetical protein GUITHDRAFT_160260 [Guillardia theta CCMP2712]|eukprot:XP_005821051.1 hypothetical protein GUITHDRAFT_160260 [Guillardia theta CCMP2712]
MVQDADEEILIDELRNDDFQQRLKSVRRLTTISSALGVERTRNELVPYLNELAVESEDEDEVLLAMAEEIGNLIPHVGGNEHVHHLLLPLETLCAPEEALVRDKAVESLIKVAEVIPNVEEAFVPLIRRLATGDYNSHRIAAAPLFATVYKRVSESSKAEMRRLFGQLSKDDFPMVRKAACTALGGFSQVLEQNHLQNEIIPLFTSLARDDQDSVRIVAVDNCVTLGRIFPTDKNQSLQDKSWRVRYMVADHFCELCESIPREVIEAEMCPALVKFLKDTEAEVRTAAAFKVAGFCSKVSVDVALNQIMPCIRDLVVDQSQHVRAALASVIMGLAPVLGKEHTIEQLVPLFLSLLKDEHHEARLNIICKLDNVNQVIGVECLSQSLLPAIIELAEDKQWRVRLAIIEHIPLLASQMGAKFFEERLAKMCITWLADSVFTIREAASLNLKKLTEVFGVQWASVYIIPQVIELCGHSNYLYRMTAINSIANLTSAVDKEKQKQMLNAVVVATKDPVPNCRFNACKAMELMLPAIDAQIVDSTVVPALNLLSNDEDPDVKFFAAKTLNACMKA